jgi:hypothetical protein
MSDFSLTNLFVVSKSNTLPTTGSTNNLTSSPAQFGIFLPDNTPATVGTVGNARYIYLAQGRNIYSANEGTKKSDQIAGSNVIEWYKVTGSLTAKTQITQVSFTTGSLACQQDVSVTIRLDSFYIRAAYNNSLTRTVMLTTPCCSCGANPCDTLTSVQYQQLHESFVTAINNDPILNQFVTASLATDLNSFYITGKTLQTYGQGTSPDLTNFPYQFDRMYFWTYIMEGPDLTTDYEVQNYCNTYGTATVLQRANYPQCTPAEIQQLEKDFFSYQAEYRHIFSNVNYNGEFQTYVDSTAAYDLYYIRFFQPIITGRDVGTTRMDETVCIAIPQDITSPNGTAITAILTAFLGNVDNDTTSNTTATTTYSTSTNTTTTTTTVQFP